MSIQKLLRSFRSSISTAMNEEFTLEEEVALYWKRAGLALAEERYNDALVFLAKILRLNPYDLQARITVAETYHLRLEEPTKALLTYEKVIAAAGYDESNPFCIAARDGIRELSTVFEAPAIPYVPFLEMENDIAESGELVKSVAG